MDQVPVVSEQLDSGKKLIEALGDAGFEVPVAFWAKPTEADKWYLYLASPFVDEKGPLEAYGLVIDVLDSVPDIWIDPFEVRVVGLRDSLATAAIERRESRTLVGPSGASARRPFPGITRLGGCVLAGYPFDGVLIYPPLSPSSTP